MWLKSQWEWEITLFFLVGITSFIIFSTIRKSNWLNIIGSSTKLEGKSFCCSSCCWSNVISETVFKEVPVCMAIWSSIIISVILTVDRVHCYKITRVLSISKEFKTKPWNKGLVFAGSNSRWHSNETLRSSFEDSSICVCFISFKSNFSNNTYRVNIFSSLSEQTTWHQITSRIECWFHRLQKETWHLQRTWEFTTCCISYNLAPKVVSLISSWQWKILEWSSILQKIILNSIFDEEFSMRVMNLLGSFDVCLWEINHSCI